MSDKFREYNVALINRGAWKELLPGAVDRGHYLACGNKHGEKGDSFFLYKESGNWKDAATGESGDLISLFAEKLGLGQGATVEELNKRYNFMSEASTIKPQNFKEDKTDYFEPAEFGGDLSDDYLLQLWRSKRGKAGMPDPSYIHRYYDINRKFRFVIFRIDYPEGSDKKKDFFPYMYGRKGRDDRVGWYSTLSGERPLYNLTNFKQNVTDCIVVEGEKKCNLLQKYIGNIINVVSWSGGAQVVQKSNWDDLGGMENVLIIPDNDLPGENAARSVYTILSGKQLIKGRLLIANLPEDKPEKWDMGDLVEELEEKFGEDRDKIIDGIKAFIKSIAVKVKHFKTEDNWVWPTGTSQITKEKKRFTCLGYAEKNGGYYFYSETRNELIVLTAKELGVKENLWVLSPRDFWYDLYGLPTSRESAQPKLNMEKIAESLITCCEEKGMVNPEKLVRDKGAFLDEGRVVIHLGDKLIADGIEKRLDLKSEYIYQKQKDPIHIDTKMECLTTQEAKDIWDTFGIVQYRSDLDLKFLMGWLFSSVLCGIWEWRSHLWIMGPSSAGKSKLKDAMSLLLKDYKKDYQNVTEAAVRRALSQKYLPCFLDEFDKDTNQTTLQAVIVLIRMNSTDSDSEMPRAMADSIIEYKIRSMFCAISTLNPLKLIQDHNRYTIINILKSDNYEVYERTLGRVRIDWTRKNYPDKFLMRVFKFARIMKEQEPRFKSFISKKRIDGRDSDQLTTITLGAWFFLNDHPPTDEELVAFIEGYDQYVSAKQENANSEFDECWSLLSTYQVRMEHVANGNRENFNTSIGYLLEYALDMKKDPRLTKAVVEDKLNLYGIRILEEHVLISNRHKNLERVFRGSNWDNKNWGSAFVQNRHAKTWPSPVRYAGGLSERATGIHIDFILNPDQNALDLEDKEPF